MKTCSSPFHLAFLVLVCGITGLLFTSHAWAESGVAPSVQHFSSQGGSFVFRILPHPKEGVAALGELVLVRENGEEREMWRKKISVVPDYRCFISERTQQVIGVTSPPGLRSKLVLYTRDGDIQKVFALDDLIESAEARRHIGRDATVRFWCQDATFGFAEFETQFVIITKWGTKIAIDLTTGTVTTNSSPVN